MFQWIAKGFCRGLSAAVPASFRTLPTAATIALGGGFVVCLVSDPFARQQDDTADFCFNDLTVRKNGPFDVLKTLCDRLSKTLRYSLVTGTQCATNVGTAEPVVKKTLEGDKIIFLGSGSSTGCPRPLCPLLFSQPMGGKDDSYIDDSPESTSLMISLREHCRTSNLAGRGNPVDNKDYRNNPSLLISVLDKATNVRKNVIIDVGKTFREGALRWLPKYHIRSVDAIILTHEHMDAAGGLDDVRGFQKYHSDKKARTDKQPPMPLFLSNICLPCLQDQFPWLLPKPKSNIGNEGIQERSLNKPVVVRHVASFDVTIFQPFQPFEPVPGLSVTPLPVMHGEDLVSYGFAFTIGGTMNVVYLSDISRMLPETLDFIRTKLPQPIHLLVLDSLLVDSTNPVHYCLPQSLELIQQLQPEQTYLVGMNCDSFGPHDEANNMLRQSYRNVQLAHDGLVIEAPSFA